MADYKYLIQIDHVDEYDRLIERKDENGLTVERETKYFNGPHYTRFFGCTPGMEIELKHMEPDPKDPTLVRLRIALRNVKSAAAGGMR